jgi:hypothetical protein
MVPTVKPAPCSLSDTILVAKNTEYSVLALRPNAEVS